MGLAKMLIRGSRASTILCAFLLCLILSVPSLPQTATGSISGTVTDSTRSPVSGAKVTLTNVGTNEVRTVTSNDLGYYSFQLLPPATYNIRVEVDGFQTFVGSGVTLNVGQSITQDVLLEIGQASQTITVSESGPQLQTDTSSLGQVLGNKSIVDLPINGRNSYGFAALVPGVRAPNLFTQVAYGSYNDQFLSINGSRVNANQFFLDGGANSTSGFNGPGIFPSIDLVQEYKVQTGNVEAEFGNTGGGVINVVTKSGTNALHGSAYDFLRNDKLEANDFFANRAGQPISPLRFNQFGATLGGPVIIPHLYNGKDETFFFFSYEGLRWVRAYTTTGTVPTLAERQGDFSHVFNSAGQPIQIYNPRSTAAVPGAPGQYTRSLFPNNVIPRSQMDPVAVNLLNYIPLPNAPGNPLTGVNNFTSSSSAPLNEDTFSIRVDQKLTESQKLFMRWSTNVNNVNRPNIYGTSNPNYVYSQPDDGTDTLHHQQAVLNYNWVINPSTVLEASSSVLHYWIGRQNPGYGFNMTQLGLPSYINSIPATGCFPGISVSGMGVSINVPDTGGGFLGPCQFTNQSYDTFHESANLTKISGAHTFKVGGVWGNNRWSERPAPSYPGFTFSSAFTQGPNPTVASPTAGVGFASFLLGTGDSGSITNINPGEFVSYHYYGAYFQDDWKVTPKLTLNLGIRYDFNAPWQEKYNRINSWNGDSPVTIAGLNLRGGLEFPGVNGVPRGQFQDSRTNFAPRFGFAYSPYAKTVIRGGYGIYYGPINGAAFAGPQSPFSGFAASTNWISTVDGVTPFSYLANPFPNGFQQAPGSSQGLYTLLGQNLQTMDRGRLTPYSQQWNFGVQQTLGNFLFDIAYSGSHGVHLFGPLNYNQLPDQYLALGNTLRSEVPNPFYGTITSGPLSTPNVQYSQLLRPYPQFNGVTAESNSYGNSIYHSLQLKVERRFSNGFGMLLSYTWSKLIDDVLPSDTFGGFPGETFSAGNIQDYYNRRAERSVSSFDTPHYLTFNSNWELPFGKGKPFFNASRWGNSILGGWQLNGILNIHSGQPLGLTTVTNTAYNYGSVQRPNYVGGAVTTSGPIADRLNNYFNVNAFAVPAPYTYGNTARLLDYLRAPGAVQLDMSLYKNIPIRDQMHLQFRAEVFNLLNHPQFDLPNTVIGSPQAGVISDQVNTPRDIQLALKFLF
jgi:Carboxypeptidase regulatory-like domain